MKTMLIALISNALGFWVASYMVSGIHVDSDLGNLLIVGGVFGIVHAALSPLAKLVTCGLQVLTLGLINLVINAFLLELTAWLASDWLQVDGFRAAFWGALVIAIVSGLARGLLKDDPA